MVELSQNFNTAQITNDGEPAFILPYIVNLTIQGSSPFLFHRWSNEDVEAKANAAKNSKVKKTDNVESYVYRNTSGNLCIPGEYIRQSIIQSAKYRQDPRSSRKSAMDLFKAGIVSLTELADLGKKEWDYLDKRRVVVQRSGITRTRPAMLEGWKISMQLQVLTPEYIDPNFLYEVLSQAGRLIGVGDFRPSYGRFVVTSYQLQD